MVSLNTIYTRQTRVEANPLFEQRVFAANAACFGGPVYPESGRNVITMLDSHQSQRATSALKSNVCVLPLTHRLYEVRARGDTTYRVDLGEQPGCECPDYIFNCLESGKKCKHNWRVRFLIAIGGLPAPGVSPYHWLQRALHVDIALLDEERKFRSRCALETLLSTIELLNPQDVEEIQDAYIRRACILSGAF